MSSEFYAERHLNWAGGILQASDRRLVCVACRQCLADIRAIGDVR